MATPSEQQLAHESSRLYVLTASKAPPELNNLRAFVLTSSVLEMPMSFPDLATLVAAAEIWKFRPPDEGESDPPTAPRTPTAGIAHSHQISARAN
jgi:hypothetical protein